MTIMCLKNMKIHDSTCVNTDSIYIVYYRDKTDFKNKKPELKEIVSNQ